jgi:hypothetical protein
LRTGNTQQLLLFSIIKPNEFGNFAASVLCEDLHKTHDEELLLLRGISLPIVGLSNCDDETRAASPLFPYDILAARSSSTAEGLHCR